MKTKKLLILFIFLILSLIFLILYYKHQEYDNEYNEHNEHNKYPYRILSDDPTIRVYKKFLTDDEINHLINKAKDNLIKSKVLENGEEILHKDRTSSSSFIKDDSVTRRIKKRVCSLLGCKFLEIENLQVVNYKKGEKYSPHFDFFNQKEKENECGQRKHTLLIYLNTLNQEDGGSTSFPELNIKIYPKKGNAVYFDNLDKDGNGNPLTLHGGDPIINDTEKWACNIWIRNKEMTLGYLFKKLFKSIFTGEQNE